MRATKLIGELVVDCCLLFFILLRTILISLLFYTNMPTPRNRTLISTTDTTTTTSSITDAARGSSDTEDNFNEESSSSLPPFPDDVIQVRRCVRPNETNAKASKKCGRSDVWKYFQVYKEAQFKAWTFCTLCSKQVNYTDTMSTGMLLRHLRKCHRKEYDSVLELDVEKKKKIQKTSESQAKISGFVAYFPSFEKAYTHWVIQTYQPLSSCENPAFRTMCQSLNIKTPFIGRERLRILLAKEATEIRIELKKALRGVYFSSTTDAWTANNNFSYSTCTVHFIDKRTWVLHRFALGIFKKTGASKAEDVVSYCEGIWHTVDLDYNFCSAVVTDTEATMCKAGRLIIQRSRANGGTTQWHGCIDHILELITKIAMKDYEGSEGTMAAARALVYHFSSSSQAEQRLLSLQQTGKPVKCIQDVVTRWWSTYSMCERLLRLKPYFDLMEAEGTLDCNLSQSQWVIITDTCTLLKPFMFAQKTFEGETYVTISMIPYILYRIRSLLQQAREAPNISLYVANLLRRMANAFELHWGSGEPGTVSREYLTEGPNRRPQGMPLITLLASLLDPRFKFGPGLAQHDKDHLWAIILHQMIGMDRIRRRNGPDNNNNNQQQQQQPAVAEDYGDNNNDDEFFDMFDELNALRQAEEARGQGEAIRNPQPEGGDSYERAQAELTLYRGEQMMPLQKEDRTYNDPLAWWRVKAQQFPLLSELAIRYLCIPATSAPSERVFSTAGLTIAKERSRIDPTTANELVFLHESLPSLKRYKESIAAINQQ